tara:strand:- start:9833 stop:12955 length:3123 start_codon:yes stop_codon:yes gene_type:complete
MTLNKKVLRVQLGRGVDTSATDIVLEPGQLEVLENAVFEKTGRLEKRKGCSSTDWDLSSSQSPTGTFTYRDNLVIQGDETVIGLVGSDNEIVILSGLGLSSYFESEIFHASGSSGYHQIQPSIALSHSGDYFAIAYVQGEWDPDQNAIRYKYVIDVLDAATGTIVNSNRAIANRSNDDDFIGKIKVVAHGDTDAADDNFAAYYEFRDSSGNITLRKAKFKHDAFTISGSDIVASSVYRQTEGENWFDVVEYTAGSGNYQKVHLVYTEYSSSTHYATYQLDTNSTLGAAAKVDAGAAMKHMTAYRSSAGGTARVYFAFAVGNTVWIRQHTEADPTSGAVGGTDAITSSIGGTIVMTESGGWCDSEDGTKVEYWCTMGTTSSTYESKTCRYQVTGGTGSFDDDGAPTRQTAWVALPPIKTSAGIHYFLSQENRNTEDNDTSLHTVTVWQDNLDNPTSLLIFLYKSIVGSTFRQELIRSHVNGITPRFVTDGSYHYSVLPRTTNIQTWSNTASGAVTAAINSQCHLIKISVDKPVYETSRVQLGGELYIAPGSIKSTSGEKVHEAGFFYKPGLSLAAAAAGSLDSSGVYQYKACWEWEDAFGNLHRSEPSDAETITLTGSDTGVTVTCDGLSMSMKSGLHLVLYRTQNAGNVFNRVATIENPPINTNFTGTDVISHHDKVSDSNAATGAFLYTEGGELANVAPPSTRYIESHRNRIFAITEDNRVWFSKEYENKVGLGWSDFFQIDLDGISHDKPTALCSSGTDLIIFRENSTWSISGEGPSKTGVGEYYKPRQVSSVIGALKNTPTLYTDTGVYFQNTRGIFLLSQSFEYIGAPVEDLVGDSRVIAIRHHQKTETIRFAFTDKVLAYNYRQKVWSNYTYSLGEGETIVGMENLDDTIHVVTSGNKILKENSSYKVGSNYIVMKLKTGWISFNEIQGFGRVYRFSILGESRDKHVMTVKVYYDYDDSASVDTYTFTTSSATDAKLQFRGHLSKQKCEAVKFEIYDADNSASTGDGFAIDHIALEVGMKKGIYRTNETNTIGAD